LKFLITENGAILGGHIAIEIWVDCEKNSKRGVDTGISQAVEKAFCVGKQRKRTKD